MRAREIMNQFVVRVEPDASIRQVAQTMRDEGVGSVCVCEKDGRAIGVITDRDLVVRGFAHPTDDAQLTARDVMTKQPLSCGLDESIENIELMMKQNRIGRVLVVDDAGLVVGMVTLAEIWHYAAPLSAESLSRALTGRQLRAPIPGGHFSVGT